MVSERGEGMMREAGIRRELDVAHLGHAIAHRKMWVLGPAVVCLLLATVGVNVVKPRYTAEAKILLENQENYFTRPDRNDRDAVPLPDDEAVQSQVQLLSSRDIARDAIRAMNLQGNAEFDPMANGVGPVTRLLVLLGIEQDPLRASAEDRMLSAYYDRLNVYPIVKSRVLSVQFTSNNPDLAAKAANTISNLYIDLQSDAKRDGARSAATSLASLIADLKVKVSAAETKAQEYRAQNGLLVGTNNTTITSQQLSDLNTQLAQARTAEADSQAKAKLLREMIKANRIADVPDVANSDLIRRISDQRITLKAQIAQQSMTLLPGHPRMQELNAQLADIDNQMRSAGEKIVRTLENDAHIAAGRVDNLSQALDTQKKTATTAGADEVTLRQLEQQASLLRDQLEFNTQKYQEAVARENAESTPADARIISRAVAPELPSFPKKLPIVAIFTLAGLILALGILIARELLSGRAFAEDAQPGHMPLQLAQMPAPAEPAAHASEAPAAPLRPTFAPLAEPGDDRLDPALLVLIAAARDGRGRGGAVKMLVTGAAETLPIMPAALRLARGLAREARVILVDCGVESATLGQLVADEAAASAAPTLGLSNLLAGKTSFAEVIHRDPASRVHILPFGTGATDHGEGMGVLVDALAETYDHVIMTVPMPRSGQDPWGADRADLALLLVSHEHVGVGTDACRAALYMAGVPSVHVLDVAEIGDKRDVRQAA